jgi:hypothetical protein
MREPGDGPALQRVERSAGPWGKMRCKSKARSPDRARGRRIRAIRRFAEIG